MPLLTKSKILPTGAISPVAHVKLGAAVINMLPLLRCKTTGDILMFFYVYMLDLHITVVV